MIDTKQMRMENPIRIAELDPMNTLISIGLDEKAVICDIGAGSGIFTLPAAKITKNKVFALEIDDEMLRVIGEKAKNEELANIELIKVEDEKVAIEDNTVDFVLMVTVLHEIENKAVFLREVKRLLKNNGKVLVIEFHKRETPIGPPVPHRIEKEEVKNVMGDVGFLISEEFDLGDNYYCLIFLNDGKKNELL